MCVESLSFKKTEEGPRPLRSSSGSALQYWHFLAFHDFENSKFLESFLLFVSIWRRLIKIKKYRYRRSRIDKDRWKFLGKLRAASVFKSADPIRSLSTFNLIDLYLVAKSGKERVKNMSRWHLGGRGFVSMMSFSHNYPISISIPQIFWTSLLFWNSHLLRIIHLFWNSHLLKIIHSSLLSSDSFSEGLIWTRRGSIQKTILDCQCRVIWFKKTRLSKYLSTSISS